MNGFRDTHFGCVYDTKGMAWGWIPVLYNAENDRVPVQARGPWSEVVMRVILGTRNLLGMERAMAIHEDGPMTEEDVPEGF